MKLAEKIILAIKSIDDLRIETLHEPIFTGNEWQYLKECLDSTYVSSVGKFVNQFESNISMYTGAKYAIACINGTAGLHIALKLAGVKHLDEVLVPALTFVATANAVCYCGATPHFIDIEDSTLGIDCSKLRDYLKFETELISNKCINRKTNQIIRAIVPVHTFGHPSNLEEITKICKEFKLELIEDAAEAMGSLYQGVHTGTLGLMGILSFNGNKTITTGGGGIILTNNENIYKRAKHIVTTAKVKHAWEFKHDEVAYNYRLPNINAALGCAQLEQLPKILKLQRDLFLSYKKSFSLIDEITLFSEPNNCKSNYWLQTIILKKEFSNLRDDVLNETNEQGIATRPAWTLMSKLDHFKNNPRMNLINAQSLEERIINIPSTCKL